jgi:hypothetical protein
MVVARLSGASKKRSRSDFGPPSTVSPYTSSVSPLVVPRDQLVEVKRRTSNIIEASEGGS